MQATTLIPVGRIDQSILLVRGHRVLLDRDLAALYGVETRVLNQAVRRNLDRFPGDFMFPLTREEVRNISQIVICSTLKHARNVFAFTEQGVAMLSSVLNSPRAVQVNIEIMRAFVRLREMTATNRELAQKLEELEQRISSHDEKIQAIFEAIRQLMVPPETPHKEIGFHVKEDAIPYRANRSRKDTGTAETQRHGAKARRELTLFYTNNVLPAMPLRRRHVQFEPCNPPDPRFVNICLVFFRHLSVERATQNKTVNNGRTMSCDMMNFERTLQLI